MMAGARGGVFCRCAGLASLLWMCFSSHSMIAVNTPSSPPSLVDLHEDDTMPGELGGKGSSRLWVQAWKEPACRGMREEY